MLHVNSMLQYKNHCSENYRTTAINLVWQISTRFLLHYIIFMDDEQLIGCVIRDTLLNQQLGILRVWGTVIRLKGTVLSREDLHLKGGKASDWYSTYHLAFVQKFANIKGQKFHSTSNVRTSGGWLLQTGGCTIQYPL